MKPQQLTRKIEALAELLKPAPREGIRLDFNSFTQPEQLVLLKNLELEEKIRGNWTMEVVLENKDLILKANQILIERTIELFRFAMPRALMLDEVEQWFFNFNFNQFLKQWIECKNNLNKWTPKDRADFLQNIKVTPKKDEENGEENNS